MKPGQAAGENVVPGFAGRLSDGELAAYSAALRAVRSEFVEVEKIQAQLNRLGRLRWDAPGNLSRFAAVETGEGIRWEAFGILLKLSKGDVVLCRRAEATDWAAIQRFEKNAPYAQAHGATEILLSGTDARAVTAEYREQAQLTVRFMASNLVAKAQKIAWEQFPENNPTRVVQALSERCNQAVLNTETLAQTPSVDDASQRTRGIRV